MGEIRYVTDRFYTEDFNADGTLKPNPHSERSRKSFSGRRCIRTSMTILKPSERRRNCRQIPATSVSSVTRLTFPLRHHRRNQLERLDLYLPSGGVGKRDYWRTDQIAWPTGGWGSLFKETRTSDPTNTNAYYPRVFQRRVNTLQPLETVEVSRQRLYPETAKTSRFPIPAQSMVPASLLRRCESILQRREPLHVGSPKPEGLETDMLSKVPGNIRS